MKIKPPGEAFDFFHRVLEKGSTDQSPSEHKKEQHEEKESKEQKAPVYEVDEARVTQAIEELAQDPQVKKNDLHFNLKGKGPGLKVVLTDGSGAIVRQMTGEEFLKLRTEVDEQNKQRGKILDQKL